MPIMIRTITTTQKPLLTLPLPPNYVGRQIEVIAFILDSDQTKKNNKGKHIKTFGAFSLDTSHFKFDREEANER